MGACMGKQSKNKFAKNTPQALKEIQKLYNIKKSKIGEGAFGSVFYAESNSDPTQKYAIKKLNKKRMNKDDIKSISSEVEILSKLDHPNIVKYYEAFEDEKHFLIVMEY